MEPISLGVTFTARVHALSSPENTHFYLGLAHLLLNPFAPSRTTQPALGRDVWPSHCGLAQLSDPMGTARLVLIRALEAFSLYPYGTEPTRSTSGGQSLCPDCLFCCKMGPDGSRGVEQTPHTFCSTYSLSPLPYLRWQCWELGQGIAPLQSNTQHLASKIIRWRLHFLPNK